MPHRLLLFVLRTLLLEAFSGLPLAPLRDAFIDAVLLLLFVPLRRIEAAALDALPADVALPPPAAAAAPDGDAERDLSSSVAGSAAADAGGGTAVEEEAASGSGFGSSFGAVEEDGEADGSFFSWGGGAVDGSVLSFLLASSAEAVVVSVAVAAAGAASGGSGPYLLTSISINSSKRPSNVFKASSTIRLFAGA